jgi:hypothetical protein
MAVYGFGTSKDDSFHADCKHHGPPTAKTDARIKYDTANLSALTIYIPSQIYDCVDARKCK